MKQNEQPCEKVTGRCAAHANIAVGSYYFNVNKVREVDKYQMLTNYGQLEAQESPQRALSNSIKLLLIFHVH